jgi:hypothetical protein
MSLSRFRLHSLVLLGLTVVAWSACFEEPPKPPPPPPPDPSVSAKELNALAAPVIPKPGAGLKLKAPVQQAAETQTPGATSAPTPAAPTPSLAPALPKPQQAPLAASKPSALAANAPKPGAKPEPPKPVVPVMPTENVDDLINPLLPNKKVAAKPLQRPVLDQSEIDAFGAPDLPPPPPGTKAMVQHAPPPLAAEAAPPPAAAPDPTNTFAAALPSGPGLGSLAGTPAAWLITDKGVGSLRPGAKLLVSGEIASHYTTSFYSDAQPLEGFTFDEPPVFVAVRNGPFSGWGRAHAGEPVPDSIKQRALELAIAGKLSVQMIVVTARGPKTKVNIGVGDSYASFAKAYPKAGIPARFPTLWEDPTCVVTQKTVWFFFDRCDDQKHAKITRIVVRGRR